MYKDHGIFALVDVNDVNEQFVLTLSRLIVTLEKNRQELASLKRKKPSVVGKELKDNCIYLISSATNRYRFFHFIENKA